VLKEVVKMRSEGIIGDLLESPELIVRLLDKIKEEREARLRAEKKIEQLLNDNKTYSTTEVARELGFINAVEFNKWLERQGVLYRVNKNWLAKTDYTKYFVINLEALESGRVVYHRRITRLGREFILNLAGVSDEEM
jgi:phage antirepressor YoqD-like protein